MSILRNKVLVIAVLILCIAYASIACGSEKQIDGPSEAVQQLEQAVEAETQPVEKPDKPQAEEPAQDITWTTYVDDNKNISISIPSEWETRTDITELSELWPPELIEAGILPLFASMDLDTGSNIMIYADTQYLYDDVPIDVDAYVQFQIDDLKNIGIYEVSTHSITIDGIRGTQVRYKYTDPEYEDVDLSGRMAILIGEEDDVRMLCGRIALMFQSTISSDADLAVFEKAQNSLHVLPTAAGDLESCD